MAIKDCHGVKKNQIVRDYVIRPIEHIQLLPGQTIYSCCRKELTDVYYQFSAEHRITKALSNFFVGGNCAKQFLKLIGHNTLPLFNPLINTSVVSGVKSAVGANAGSAVSVSPLNQEVATAIRLYLALTLQPAMPGRLFDKVLSKINSVPNQSVATDIVIKVNKAIGAKSLQQRMSVYPVGTFRKFLFPSMIAILIKANQPINL